MVNEKYVNAKEAKKLLGVHSMTLRRWDKSGKIETMRTTGGHRMYNIEKYMRENNKNKKEEKRVNVCYIRVSTKKQEEDLDRQREYMKKRYPEYEIIEDIGSGINFNRAGLKRIIHMGIEGKIEKLIVAYKDRLTRFGYEMIEEIITKYSKGEIIIINKTEKKNAQEELAEDVIQILNVYTAKMNGLRKYGNK